MRKVVLIIGLFMLLITAATGQALAYAIITINPTGDGSSYTVSVTGLQDAHYVGFTIAYDPGTLSSPQVVANKMSIQADAAIQTNSATPGLLSAAFLSKGAFKSPGDLATIRFNRIGSALPVITKVDSSALTTASMPLAVDLVVNKELASPAVDNVPVSTKTETGVGAKTPITQAPAAGMGFNSTVSPATATASSGGSGGMTGVSEQIQQQYRQQSGGVTVSVNTPFLQDSGKSETRPDEPRGRSNDSSSYNTPPAYNPPVANSSTNPVQVEGAQNGSVASVKEAVAQLNAFVAPVQRFRSFNGIRNLKSLIALFDPAARQAGITQTPEIAISDGKSLLKLRIELATAAVVPNFSLKNANLKSIHPLADKIWELEALPQKGKSDVRLSVFIKNEKVDIPILVIPPLDAAVIKETKELSEGGVSAMLAKMALKSDKPAYDLNNDGRQDYLDDLVLVGHYILKLQKQELSMQKQVKIPNSK
ncbi:MAG TPA: hypothetical protein VGJ93_00295 [Desulfuromonadaceae bacterium]|jgi:hypothetical protein